MQSGPHGHPLLVTGQPHPRGWSSGHLLESGLSICLHEIDTPVAALQDAPESDIHVFFSGETKGAIPWAVDGWQSLEKQVTEAREGGSGRLLLRPHHRHVLADAPACRHWLFSREPEPPICDIALSPTSILVDAMLESHQDHIERLFEFVGESSGVVIVEDFQRSDTGEVQCIAPGSGLLDGALMGSLIRDHVPAATPVVVHAGSIVEAKSWLWPSSVG